MSLIASERGNDNGEVEYAITPAGQYIARCYRIIDEGTQTTVGQFGTKTQPKVMVSWELFGDWNEDQKDQEGKVIHKAGTPIAMNDGRPYSVHQTYTVSLHEKAKLRADLELWRGKHFSIEELAAFDLASVLGAYCQIQVVHDETGKYANVQTIMAYKGDKPKAVNPDTVFNLDEPDMAVFDKLSDNMKLKITSSPEWAALQAKSEAPVMQTLADEFGNADIEDSPINLSDIPF